METMNVEQAVFASSDRGSIKGYQLISKSSGLDRASRIELCRWAPTRLPSDNPSHWTLNCFPISNNSFAITRTVLGGPEYSGRGGTEVVTLFLVLRDEQFAAYGFNPIAVARTAMGIGWLRLPLDKSCAQLPPATLPIRSIAESRNSVGKIDDCVVDEVVELLDDSRRVAVGGLDQPLDFVDCLISRMPAESRKCFSFTTGLSASVNRPFQAHFFSSDDSPNKQTLDSQGIQYLSAT
ncbi:hypothetical protein CA13_52780 [Planctomycetes bacterium CA13]|uniref:GTPase-associated protein 1 N-terminal domain-containing protein n=1 Tax=Novipirellula herctigrandis TaxID=2527986 RepID=A0A5C5Z9N2_9BACT|nr:hypothetical protein CA13_52780 [Planctomycetes bacterium CA13]